MKGMRKGEVAAILQRGNEGQMMNGRHAKITNEAAKRISYEGCKRARRWGLKWRIK